MMRTCSLALMLVTLGSCMEDTVPIPEPGRPLCMVAYATRGHLPDGTNTHVIWPGRSPAGCACIPPGNQVEVGRSERLSDEVRSLLNDLAYEDCEAAARWGGFVDNECRIGHDSGKWLEVIVYAGLDSDDTNYLPPDLHCADDLSTPWW